jgi:hypothetical protein
MTGQAEGRPVRADLIAAGDIIRVPGDRAAEVRVPDLLNGYVGIPYTECRGGKNGFFSCAAAETVTLLRSAGTRAAA